MLKHLLSRRRVIGSSALLGAIGGLFPLGLRFGFDSTAMAQTVSIPPSLFDDPTSPIAGNPLGTVNVVEFFDYRCPYCRMMAPRLNEVIKQDNSVRLIYKDWPIFGGISIYAAKVALASNWQGKYLPVHAALFALPRTMTQDSIRHATESSGVDLKQLDEDLTKRAADIDAILGRNDMEAQALQLQGTPGFVIGHTLVPGALTEEQLQQLVHEAKQK